jgi:DcuC family C4-dicarboxylate transporter
MMIALSLVAMVVAFGLIWRGFDVRPVLFSTALLMGALAGQPGVVFRKIAEALTDPKYVLPLCGAMGFSYVVRETECLDDLVSLLLRPVAKVARLVVPGSSAVAFFVNSALPSQTSTLAAVGPLSIALIARLEATRQMSAIAVGSFLVLGSSIAGELLNPGVAQISVVAANAHLRPTELVVWLAPAGVLALAVAIGAMILRMRLTKAESGAPIATFAPAEAAAARPSSSIRWRAILPLLPLMWLMAGHPSLPTAPIIAKVTPAGLEVFTAMMVGIALTIATTRGDRAKAGRAALDGMGFSFAHIVTLVAVAAGIAKGLEVAGVLAGFVAWAAGHATAALGLSFLLSFLLAVISGSGIGPSVALATALTPRAAELGLHPLALGGAILFGAEAGRTTSPVAAVVNFGGALVSATPRALAWRLVVPCLCGGVAGALVCILRAS